MEETPTPPPTEILATFSSPVDIDFEVQPAAQFAAELAPVLVVGVTRGGEPALATPLAGTEVAQHLAGLARTAGFPGKRGEARLVSNALPGLPRAVLLTGLGEKEQLDRLAAERAFAQAARMLRGGEFPAVAVLPAIDGELSHQLGPIVEGFLLGSYTCSTYLSEASKKKADPVKKVFVLADGPAEEVAGRILLSKIIARATNLARELANAPGSDLNPPAFADKILQLGNSIGIHSEVWKYKRIEAQGMGLLLAVGKGSVHEPRLVKMTYKPEGRPVGTVVLVGKGITFDTGGIDLKKREGMESMKGDKAGAAAVVATLLACKEAKVPLRVIGILAIAENMPSSKSYKPGDVFKSASGKTVEVGDTDAEGRLILADALAYASTLECDAVIDVATLTGSCAVGLGPQVAGLFSNDDQLAEQLMQASDEAGERLWPLPLEVLYRPEIDSDVADLKNVASGRYGDAIHAANFLREFVGSKPWAHLDIAGPSWTDEESPAAPAGATGYGVRTLANFLLLPR